MSVRQDLPADGVVVLYLGGEVDLSARRELSDVLADGMAAASRAMILDLSGIGFLDSTGLNALVRARNSLKLRGVPFVLASVNGVGRLLELAGLSDFFPASASVDTALTELGLSASRST